MSTAISTAIVARLSGTEILTGNPLAVKALAAQTLLATLLTTNPQTDLPLTVADPITGAVTPRGAGDAIRWGSKGASPIYPEITFRPSGGLPDRTFEDGSFVADTPFYDFEIWDNSLSGTLLTDIELCVKQLLDRRYGAPQLPITTGYCVWCELLVCAQALYDREIKSWFLLLRLRFWEAGM